MMTSAPPKQTCIHTGNYRWRRHISALFSADYELKFNIYLHKRGNLEYQCLEFDIDLFGLQVDVGKTLANIMNQLQIRPSRTIILCRYRKRAEIIQFKRWDGMLLFQPEWHPLSLEIASEIIRGDRIPLKYFAIGSGKNPCTLEGAGQKQKTSS